MTPVVDRFRLSVRCIGICVGSLSDPRRIPVSDGEGFLELLRLGDKAPVSLLIGTVLDGTNAGLIMFAISFGLVVPKLCIEHFYQPE